MQASTFLFAFLTHTMVPQVVAELVSKSTPAIDAHYFRSDLHWHGT